MAPIFVPRGKSFATLIGIGVLLSTAALAETPKAVSVDDRKQIEQGRKELAGALAAIRAPTKDVAAAKGDLWADAAVFAKGVEWALRYEPDLKPGDLTLLKKAIRRGKERAEALAAGTASWAAKKGTVVRGYVSAVDGSTQPFGLIVPARYDPAKPIRLDVVLHGSTKPVGLVELRFMDRFDGGDGESKAAPQQDFIELHPLGRVENCYRWAGETDVFEAIDAVCRNYNIDRDRIVLRGMSMGASGAWHLGLKHPDRFVALGPYCGYVDTHQFSQTPLAHFVKVGPLPPHQEKALHMLDSIDYAANAGVVPVVAAMGEKDPFFDAHVLMGKAMSREGLKLINLISPGTGHVIDPVVHKEQMRQIGEDATKGIDRAPKRVRFVTWTLKYSRCHWLQILGLKEHYARAEIEATAGEGGTLAITEPKNITRFAILPPMLQGASARLRVGGTEIALPASKTKPRSIVVGLANGRWTYLGTLDTFALNGKRPGLQGPIDDAFTTPFLCVRGTGKAWNPAAGQWCEANLKRFGYEWARYLRGDLPIKDDTAVTEADLRRCNLVLLGDPGSNRWIDKILPQLPIQWTRDSVRVNEREYVAADHVPVLIYPNPLPGAEGRYIVLNSGHTFHEKELASVNYLLFPRLGDWAVLKLPGKVPAGPSGPLDEEVVGAGFFDENWQFSAK